MKELSLLMFLFGCGWVLAEFIGRFSAQQTRKLHFYIPSTSQFNILWGFIFYMGFAALMVPKIYKVWPLLGILVLLGFIIYYRGLRHNLLNPQSVFYLKEINRRLVRQENGDARFDTPYCRREALRVLGLPSGIESEDSQISERFDLLEKFLAKKPEMPYLRQLIDKLRQALFPVKY